MEMDIITDQISNNTCNKIRKFRKFCSSQIKSTQLIELRFTLNRDFDLPITADRSSSSNTRSEKLEKTTKELIEVVTACSTSLRHRRRRNSKLILETLNALTLYRHIKTAEHCIMIQQYGDWYTH